MLETAVRTSAVVRNLDISQSFIPAPEDEHNHLHTWNHLSKKNHNYFDQPEYQHKQNHILRNKLCHVLSI